MEYLHRIRLLFKRGQKFSLIHVIGVFHVIIISEDLENANIIFNYLKTVGTIFSELSVITEISESIEGIEGIDKTKQTF